MTTSTCHFLPLSAAKNIPRCNITTTKTRRKRFASVVSLAVAPASLGISVSNSLQIANLQQQVAVVENSLSRLSQTVDICIWSTINKIFVKANKSHRRTSGDAESY